MFNCILRGFYTCDLMLKQPENCPQGEHAEIFRKIKEPAFLQETRYLGTDLFGLESTKQSYPLFSLLYPVFNVVSKYVLSA